MKLINSIAIAVFALSTVPLIAADDATSPLSSIVKPGKTYIVALPTGTLPGLRGSGPPSFERSRVTIVENIGAGWYRVEYKAYSGLIRPDQPGTPEIKRALVNFAHASLIEEPDEQPAK